MHKKAEKVLGKMTRPKWAKTNMWKDYQKNKKSYEMI